MPSWDFQRAVAAVMLGVTQEDGFALAGSGAIREYGLTDRPTQDVDLFTMNVAEARFAGAVDHAMAALTEHGYDASLTRRAALFARLIVTKGDEHLEVDLGVDWRGHDPVMFDIGPVLAIDDAVANKAERSTAAPQPVTSSTSTPSAGPSGSPTPGYSSSRPSTTPDSMKTRSPISSAWSQRSAQAPSPSTASLLSRSTASRIDYSRGAIGSCTTSRTVSATTCGRPSTTGPSTAQSPPATTDLRTEESRSSPTDDPQTAPMSDHRGRFAVSAVARMLHVWPL